MMGVVKTLMLPASRKWQMIWRTYDVARRGNCCVMTARFRRNIKSGDATEVLFSASKSRASAAWKRAVLIWVAWKALARGATR